MIALIALVLVSSTARGQALTGPGVVTGTRGGSVSIECSYEAEYRDMDKYWCRGSGWSCDKVVEASMSEREVRKDRVTIRDAPRTGTFTVVMEGLRSEDAGSYVCGINRPASLDVQFSVSVVLTDPSKTIIPTVSGTLDAEDPSKTIIPTVSGTLDAEDPSKTIIPTVSGTLDAEDPSKTQSTVTPTLSGTSDAEGAEEKEGGSPFSAFNAAQVAQIVILLLIVTVTSLLCRRGTFQSTSPDSPEYVNTSMAS